MLEELRKKSKGTKDAYAFWGAAIVTGLVALVWTVSLPVRFSEVGTVANVETAAGGDGALSQFFSKMKENISDTWQQNKEAFGGLEEGEEETPDDPAESETTSLPPDNVNAIIIATTSDRSIMVATTSEPAR